MKKERTCGRLSLIWELITPEQRKLKMSGIMIEQVHFNHKNMIKKQLNFNKMMMDIFNVWCFDIFHD